LINDLTKKLVVACRTPYSTQYQKRRIQKVDVGGFSSSQSHINKENNLGLGCKDESNWPLMEIYFESTTNNDTIRENILF